jgi:hypothetical protein
MVWNHARTLAFVAALAGASCDAPAARAPVKSAEAQEVADSHHYSFLFGSEYRTQQDLYLFVFTPDPEVVYIGAHGDRAPELPLEVTPAHLGRVFHRAARDGLGDFKVVDVVPAGAKLTIESETHEVTGRSGIHGAPGYAMGFTATISIGAKRVEYVRTEFIQARDPNAGASNQRIAASFAQPLSR